MRKLLLILITFFSPLLGQLSQGNACASETHQFVTFSIDKNIYAQINEDQQEKLLQRLNDLNFFIEEKVKTKIPAYLEERLKSLSLRVSLTDKPGRDGLFIPQTGSEHVISIQLNQVYSNGIYALLAHEIFHALHYQINPDEMVWIREGLAQLFEFITTGELNGMNLLAAINNPMTPLLGNYTLENKNAAQYGHNQLYFYYLYSHCGEADLFWKITAGNSEEKNLRGSYLIDNVLQQMNSKKSECKNFTESAISFEVAKLHNEVQFSSEEGRNEGNKYFIIGSDITPRLPVAQSASQLKVIIQKMPLLSSFKMPLKKFKEYKGSCQNCAFYYAKNEFPYTVTETIPLDIKNIDIILVKLSAD